MQPSEEKITRKSKREPMRLLEVVDDLFPANDVTLTPAEIAFYRQAGGFAFASDRQSLDDTLQDPTKTGQEARVQAILHAGEWLGLHLPPPPENPRWLAGGKPVAGELQYAFGEPKVKPFWFVDGTAKKASGYIINRRSRPELWRAYHTAIRLAEANCPVRAFIVGEPTRFFRSAKWLNLFAEALWGKGIKLYVVPFGEITPHTIGAYVQYVNALSGRLQEHRKNAMDAYRRRGKIFNRRCAFGLSIDREAEHPVTADPVKWPILYDLCHRVALGELRRAADVRDWLLTEHGVKRSLGWVSWIFHDRGGMLDGIYKVYRYHYTPCEREDPSGLVRDIAVTEAGNRRYERQDSGGDCFDIAFPPGTAPIPAEVVAAARARLIDRRGRPASADGKRAPLREQVLIPTRKLRCFHCGCGVTEFNPGQSHGHRRNSWNLQCNVITRIVQRHGLTPEQAREHPLARSHPHYRGEELSGPLWEVLKAELTRQAPLPKATPSDSLRERERLQARQQAANARLEQVTKNFLLLAAPSARVVALTQAQQQALETEVAELQAQIELLAAEAITSNRRAETFEFYRQQMGRYLNQPDLSADKKREVVEAMVEEVTVNLETGEFTVTIRTPEPVKRSGQTNNHTSTTGCVIIVLSGMTERLRIAA